MTDERLDALLEAWADERARAERAELRTALLELAAFELLYAETPEDRTAAWDRLAELVG